jgi:hypothetical protein
VVFKRGRSRQLVSLALLCLFSCLAAQLCSPTGKLFHSGIPQKAINPIELAMDALNEVQTRFYKDFPAHPSEAKYNFGTSSTMKPTAWCMISGCYLLCIVILLIFLLLQPLLKAR